MSEMRWNGGMHPYRCRRGARGCWGCQRRGWRIQTWLMRRGRSEVDDEKRKEVKRKKKKVGFYACPTPRTVIPLSPSEKITERLQKNASLRAIYHIACLLQQHSPNTCNACLCWAVEKMMKKKPKYTIRSYHSGSSSYTDVYQRTDHF